MIDKRWDDLFQIMLKDAEEQEIAELSMQPLTPSPNFEKAIKKLIAQNKKTARKRRMIRYLSKAAVILLVIFATLSAAYVFSPTARAMMQKIIRIIYSGHNSYRFGTRKVELKKGDYSLGYIPEGFEPVEEIEWHDGYGIDYKNKENILSFSYRQGKDRNISVDNENMTHTNININGMEGFIAQDTETLFTVAVLVDEDIVLKLTADLEYNEAIKVLENIQKH
ncbi:MAG: DUF4367 domain-containing protein [Peptostreptococcaceae bacterium]|nr:DUF4367 domain-containing protein [Peptostreptococcaceae bacterium]